MADVSVIIPILNEEDSIETVVSQINDVLKQNAIKGEVIIVDDGSSDKTKDILKKIERSSENLVVLSHRTNLGKSEALMTGFRKSRGDIIFFMDGDLQYDAGDMPKYLEKIHSGFDVVNGWRVERQDGFFRKIPSKAYNVLTNLILGPKLHDHNCGMKAFRKEAVKEVLLRTGQHRYIVSLAHKLGYRVCEVEIRHHPRKHGSSKYASPIRLYSGVIDLFALRFSIDYSNHPLMLFASLGGIMVALSTIPITILLYLFITREAGAAPLKEHLPLTLFTVTLVLSGILFFVFGLLADMISALKKDVESIKNSLER